MNFLSWLFSKGLAGTISKDLLIKYLAIKRQHPNEDNKTILERVWNFWLTLNEETIRAEDGQDKKVRLQIIKEKCDGHYKHESLLDIYRDVLYIETEISINDGKVYDRIMQVFIKKAQQYGLDFNKEYETFKVIMNRLDLFK